MTESSVVIPEKIFFKIGEVCDLVGVQAHVLRYWESEFNALSPQKNRSGQRSYRRKDVQVALRIKELLYNEKFTIAGAKKKLQEELRDGGKHQVVPVPDNVKSKINKDLTLTSPKLFPGLFSGDRNSGDLRNSVNSNAGNEGLKIVAAQLLELRVLLKKNPFEEQ